MVVWRRTVTTDARGRSREEVSVTEDRILLARLDDLASEGYYDPEVDVRLEDFASSLEDGGAVSGSELVLERRHVMDAEDVEAAKAAVERTSGVPFEEWQRRRAERIDSLPTLADRIEGDIVLAEAAGEETSELVVNLAPEPATVVPRRLTAILPCSELEHLDRDLERAEAMAKRGQEIVELQEPFERWAEEQGAEVLGRGWLHNTLSVRAPAALLRDIVEQPGVLTARRAGRITANANFPLDVVRSGIQVQPFLDAGYDGDRTSSRNAHGIWLGILESNYLSLAEPDVPSLNTINPGWRTNAVTTRIQQTWECPDPPIECGFELEPCEGDHGMHVASVATADFLDGQMQGLPFDDQKKRSGIAQEASVWLATYTGGAQSFRNAVQRAIEDNVDVINHSAGDGACDPGAMNTVPVNDAYDDGIIWINSLGNQQMCGPHPCNANDQSAAYSSIAVGGTDAFDDGSFDDPRLCENWGTADGNADWGWAPFKAPIADLAAPAGVYLPMACGRNFDPNPQGFCEGTSLSAPHVSGAVTLLKDFWIHNFGDASAQSPGRMHMAMLLMGDGCSYFGLDGRWGAGRLRMRKFDSPGLDFPYSARFSSTTLSSGDSARAFAVNPNAGGAPQALPATVDALVVSACCKVANPETASLWVALNLYDHDRAAFPPVDVGYPGEKARIGISPEAHRYSVGLVVSGIDYPATIPCWVGIVFEDSARDDADGPPASIEPYYVRDPYFQGQAAQPANCIPAEWCN